ncbi:hypothetical protein ACFX1S_022444 [Malus domestica]
MGNEMGNNNTSGLRDEENTTVGEVADKPLAKTTLANDTKEENEVVPEDEGKDFHENIANLASDDPKRIQDTCVDDHTSDITGEEDGKMQLDPSINNSGYEKPVERDIEENDLHGTIEHHFEKQASSNKEEEGTMSTSHDPGPKESTHVELHHHEMATVDADDRTVEDVSGSLEGGSEDSLGSNPDFEVNGHLSDAEVLEIVGESVDPVMEKQRDDFLLEPKASQEQFESFEEKSETTDGGKVECGFSIVTAMASMEAVRMRKSPNSHLEAPEPEDKCMIPVIEPDSFNLTEPQSEVATIVSILKSVEKVHVFNPLSDRDCRIEETKVDENGNLVVMCVGNQSEDSVYHFSDLEEKVEVFPELVMVPVELTVALCNDDEEEATEKTVVEENGNKTEPLCAIAVDHDQAEALAPQSTDSILNSKYENCGEFFAMKASTFDFNNWIAKALDSMNKLALDMPGQHVIKQNKSSQTEAKAEPETKVAASQSNGQCEKVETSESIQKSPSFSVNLQNEARTEESDSTPLLYHVKAAIEGSTSQGDDVTLGSFIEYTGYDQEEEEGARTVVTPQEDDKHSTAENSTKNLLDSRTKEAARAPTTSSKGKAKRRQRSSLFTNCMCCATVIN